MNIPERIALLTKLIDDNKRAASNKAREFVGGAEEKIRYCRELGKQCARDTADWQYELEALKSPIVSMVVTHDNRVILATQYCVFELIGDKMVLVTFERKI